MVWCGVIVAATSAKELMFDPGEGRFGAASAQLWRQSRQKKSLLVWGGLYINMGSSNLAPAPAPVFIYIYIYIYIYVFF